MAEIFDAKGTLVLYPTMLESKDKEIFEVKDEEGKILASFEASPEAAAIIIYLVQEAVETQRKKVAKWMTGHGFTTGEAKSLEELLTELSSQINDTIKDLRRQIADLRALYVTLESQLETLKARYNAGTE